MKHPSVLSSFLLNLSLIGRISLGVINHFLSTVSLYVSYLMPIDLMIYSSICTVDLAEI